MKITVVTVVFNGAASIEKTISSVLSQKIMPYEYLIVDGASKDKTVEIAQKYEKEFISKGVKYKIVSEPDKGLYDAFNKAAKLATGDFIAYLNSDDWYNDDAIETVINAYKESPFDFGYGSINYEGKNGSILIKKSKIDSIVSSRNWNHPSSFVKRSLYIENPFEWDKFKVYADFDWFLKMRKRNDIKICVFPDDKPIAHFKTGGASINSDLKATMKRAKEKYYAYKKNGYSRLYWFEAYSWELVKYCFAKIVG